MKNEIITSGFLEGPLLALTQTAGAEKVFMDMINNRSAVHKGLETMTAVRRRLRQRLRQHRRPRPVLGLPVGQLLLPGRQGVRRVRGPVQVRRQAERADHQGRQGLLHTQLRRPAPPGHPDQGLQAGDLQHGLLSAHPRKPIAQGGHRQGLRGRLPARRHRSTPSSSCAAPSRRWRPPP